MRIHMSTTTPPRAARNSGAPLDCKNIFVHICPIGTGRALSLPLAEERLFFWIDKHETI